MKHIKLFEQFLNESAEIPAAFMADKTVVQGGDAYTAADFNEVVSKLKACGNVKVPVRPSGMSPIIEITLKKQPIKITYMKFQPHGYSTAWLEIFLPMAMERLQKASSN